MAEEQQSTALKNTVTIEEAGPCKKKVIIQIPEESVKNATDEQYESLRKEALVPGFRKGRAPRRLLEKRFGKETTEQVKLKLLAEASDSAIKDNELGTLREPDIDFEKIELPADGPLKFDFEIEVRPEFDLPQLEGIAVNKTKLEVTDEQIDREIKQLQKWAGQVR
ncbi:Trigger factor [subsurface metagenome]